MQYGEQNIDGHWYFFDKVTGAMATGLTNIGYKTCLYNDQGQMQYGLQTINGKPYYFDKVTGAMLTGLTNEAGKYYDANAKGILIM